MQPIRQLMEAISELATPQACLFTPADLRALLPKLSDIAFKTLLSRAVKEHYLSRICRGLYLYPKVRPEGGLILQHAVSKLRPLGLNYLSLETVLSDAGVISQIPINRIMVMSSGRSSVIECGNWGSIEFVHTRQQPAELADYLSYDEKSRLWRANISQAIRDMKATHRSLDLIDWSVVNELI
jgi:predicted transcriptional regulator of viral defense system